MKSNLDIFNMDLSNVPEELKKAMMQTNAALKRRNKTKEQLTLWREELDVTEDEFSGAQKNLSALLNRWDPETNKIAALEELPEKHNVSE